MKSNAYVSIEAHVLECRLHHHNELSYSVALKSGKDQLVCTAFKPSTDLMINMDTRLSLQADKHSFQQFPKLTLIVNVMGENKERKTVGSTFANYRKEGVQTFQISQCSCKVKAFEVDISFTTKILQLKSSNTKSNKNQSTRTSKYNYLSQQPSLRSSREIKAQMIPKPLKQNDKKDLAHQVKNLREVRSEQTLGQVKQLKQEKGEVQLLKRELAALNQKVVRYEEKLEELKRYKKMMGEEQINSEKWQQLLELEQEKNTIAISHIFKLEQFILNLMPKMQNFQNISPPSFKIIEEEDQLILINEELQNELEKERKLTQALKQEISDLKNQLQTMTLQLKQSQTITMTMPLPPPSRSSSFIETTNEIMLTSRCKERGTQTERWRVLGGEIEKLQQKYNFLKQEIEKFQQMKKNFSKEITAKSRTEIKKVTTPLTNKHQIPLDSPKKTEKPKSKEKPPKLPPMKAAKKSVTGLSSSGMAQSKTTAQINKSSSSSNKKTEAASEGEAKTEGGESINKSSDIRANQVINEIKYWGNTFEQKTIDFQ